MVLGASVTPLVHATCDAVVSIFETGHLPSPAAYATATVLPDGAGISYGRAQATRGTLTAILDAYALAAGSYAAEIRRVLGAHRIEDAYVFHDEAGAAPWVRELLAVLRSAGGDTVMRAAQDDVFSRMFFQPASAYASGIGLREPLSILALYDTAVHSGIGRIGALRPAFPALPPVRGGAERTWTSQFLEARRRWLETFLSADAARQRIVRSTVYRVDALLALVREERWSLARPLTVRGITIR